MDGFQDVLNTYFDDCFKNDFCDINMDICKLPNVVMKMEANDIEILDQFHFKTYNEEKDHQYIKEIGSSVELSTPKSNEENVENPLWFRLGKVPGRTVVGRNIKLAIYNELTKQQSIFTRLNGQKFRINGSKREFVEFCISCFTTEKLPQFECSYLENAVIDALNVKYLDIIRRVFTFCEKNTYVHDFKL
jgi:hypothetical protein